MPRAGQDGRAPLTHGGDIGQVWRGGHGRQTGLARLGMADQVIFTTDPGDLRDLVHAAGIHVDIIPI